MSRCMKHRSYSIIAHLDVIRTHLDGTSGCGWSIFGKVGNNAVAPMFHTSAHPPLFQMCYKFRASPRRITTHLVGMKNPLTLHWSPHTTHTDTKTQHSSLLRPMSMNLRCSLRCQMHMPPFTTLEPSHLYHQAPEETGTCKKCKINMEGCVITPSTVQHYFHSRTLSTRRRNGRGG